MLARAAFILKLNWGRSCFQAPSCDCGGSPPCLAVGWKTLSALPHTGSSIGSSQHCSCSIRAEARRARDCKPDGAALLQPHSITFLVLWLSEARSAHMLKNFSSVLSDVRLSVTHGLQHARPPCPSPAPRVHPNSCPLSRWCHPTISRGLII